MKKGMLMVFRIEKKTVKKINLHTFSSFCFKKVL